MKRNLLLLLAAGCIFSAGARGTIDVKGVTYTVDTTFHAKVGPGTTQTSLELRGTSNPLNVHYLTIDITTPGVSIRSVCATDKVAGTARTSAMAQSKSKDGVFYFAGANADFFSTSGTSSNGKSVVGTPNTSTTVEREIYKTSNSNYQFSVDTAGVARVCRLNYYTGTATIGEKVTLFKGVNVMSPNNGITIYTPRYWGSANQGDYAGNCNQVTAKLVEGDVFNAGGKFRLVVTSDPTTDGDTPVPSDGFVIHGRGTSKTGCNTGAKGFVGALKKGDVVEFDNIILTPEGERIYPRTIVSGNPKNVGGGQTLDTEGERNDASARHPRTSIGVSEDGSKIIMMVIDGRVSYSVGVTTSMLADVMRYAGAYEAVNLDGGGSSTLYTAALGVRNNCSDGSERAVGNAVFAVLEAPEAPEVAEIAFSDWAKRVPALGLYEPVVYAYNKYGKLIDTDYKDFTLECDPAFGTIVNDGKGFMATGAGTGLLTARTASGTATIAVTILDDAEVAPKYPEVLLRDNYSWPVELESNVDNNIMSINPAAFSWTSGDAAVV
ncbi:MAG: phosphodiester glycosidase family protein, partial [Muribaculaceae bacterium]|nr:phosphodiester glycosidase family protein [Muribaculaceae bacterium]